MSLIAGVTALAQAIAADFKALYAGKVDKVTGKGLSTTDFTQTEKDKLSAVAPGATANSSDVALLSRANHTGNQAISTVVNLQTFLDAKEPTIPGSTATNYWNGLKGWSDFAGSVRAALLTGLDLTASTAVVAGDTLLAGIGKLQKQITDNAALIAAKASLSGATFTGKVIGTLLSMAGYLDKTVINASATGTVTLDLSTGSVFDLTLTGNTALAFSNVPALSAETYCVLVRVRQGATAYTFTQPSGTTPITSGGAVPATPAANKIAEYIYSTANGTAWNLYAGPST